jgi:DNA-binding winged helix-turn-helix (wHTH) protein
VATSRVDNHTIRFGKFELDLRAEQLRRQGLLVRMPPQPFKLLALLAARAGDLVTREEIRRELWGEETFVDFEQGVNFSIKQVRAALGDDAERPLYIETVPKRGYRFIAPVERPIAAMEGPVPRPRGTDIALHKALWANIADLKLIEERRRRRRTLTVALLAAVILLTVLIIILW